MTYAHMTAWKNQVTQKEKSREKGEGDGKSDPEGKPEEGGEFPTFVPVFSSPPSYGCPFGWAKIQYPQILQQNDKSAT